VRKAIFRLRDIRGSRVAGPRPIPAVAFTDHFSPALKIAPWIAADNLRAVAALA
jgi:hypothetical protein